MFRDIYYGLRKSTNDVIYTLESLKIIYDNLVQGDIKQELYEFLYDKCVDECICPYCIDTMIVKDMITNVHEYSNGMITEVHAILKCERCGREYE